MKTVYETQDTISIVDDEHGSCFIVVWFGIRKIAQSVAYNSPGDAQDAILTSSVQWSDAPISSPDGMFD